METSTTTWTPYERCLAAIEGRTPDRVPAYTPTICCDVAGKILGREVVTGGPSLWYAEARAWAAGKELSAAPATAAEVVLRNSRLVSFLSAIGCSPCLWVATDIEYKPPLGGCKTGARANRGDPLRAWRRGDVASEGLLPQ